VTSWFSDGRNLRYFFNNQGRTIKPNCRTSPHQPVSAGGIRNPGVGKAKGSPVCIAGKRSVLLTLHAKQSFASLTPGIIAVWSFEAQAVIETCFAVHFASTQKSGLIHPEYPHFLLLLAHASDTGYGHT
jgi:hypothetical protein